jgi:hypothetical protein
LCLHKNPVSIELIDANCSWIGSCCSSRNPLILSDVRNKLGIKARLAIHANKKKKKKTEREREKKEKFLPEEW